MILTRQEEAELARYIETFDFRESIRGRHFLVTGSKGIVGSGIIKWLLYENFVHRTGVSIVASTRNPTDLPSWIEADDKIEYCAFGNEGSSCADQRIDYVIHAAAPTSKDVFLNNPAESLETILDGTRNALRIAREHGSKMLYISSEEVYGTPNLEKPVTEDYVGAIDSMNIRSCYPLGKKAAELLCRCYSDEYGVDVRVIRPTVILGLWQPYDSVKVEAEILRCVLEGNNLVLQSDGSTCKSVIYSLDAVSAMLTVLFKSARGGVFNATNPDTYCSVRERAEMAFAKFAPNLSVEFSNAGSAQGKGYLPTRRMLEDCSLINGLGWQPLADMNHIYQIDIERFCAIRNKSNSMD